MGGHELPKIPDYRIYKVEDCPQLMRTQRMLAQHGLKDPWIRNEVWRYPQPECQLGPYEGIKRVFFRKFKWGLGLTVLTIVGEKTYHHFYPEEHYHH